MNRRSFLKLFGAGVVTAAVPLDWTARTIIDMKPAYQDILYIRPGERIIGQSFLITRPTKIVVGEHARIWSCRFEIDVPDMPCALSITGEKQGIYWELCHNHFVNRAGV